MVAPSLCMAFKGTLPSELWMHYSQPEGKHLLELDLNVAIDINNSSIQPEDGERSSNASKNLIFSASAIASSLVIGIGRKTLSVSSAILSVVSPPANIPFGLLAGIVFQTLVILHPVVNSNRTVEMMPKKLSASMREPTIA